MKTFLWNYRQRTSAQFHSPWINIMWLEYELIQIHAGITKHCFKRIKRVKTAHFSIDMVTYQVKY
jgi:hypothetical protein